MRAGRLILMGSGETSNRLLAAHRLGIEAAKAHQVLVLDTPYGFQENATLNSEKLATFFTTSLSIEAGVVSYRSAEAGALACEEMLAAVRRARYVFAGPGSPTYALGVWKETPLASALRDLLSTGATVTVASAAALTAGVKTLPVYEIYKVGSGLGWLEGLDLTSHLGLEAVFIPHWNNTEGQGFDTSRCYMGRRRFELLKAMLPAGLGIIGVDEHTVAVIDFGKGELSVIGAGGVALCGERNIALGDGEYMELGTVLRLLGGYSPPAAGQQPDLLADLPQALANRSAREIAATPHQKTLLELESQAALWVLGGLVEAARIGVSGGVVTRGHSDLCFFDLICPTPPRRPWAFRCWPDQKPVHPQGVTRHSPAVTVCALRGTSPVRTRKRRFLMLATMVKHVIGIDPDRDRVTASVVDTATTGEQASGVFGTTRSGYDRLLKWADQHTQAAGRVWSVEGSGSYGAGVTGYLIARGELVKEFNDPAPTRDGAKPDALDARRAARQVLGRPWPSVPRARGDREALRVLETTRQGAQGARVSAINQLKALVVTAPVDLRDQLRGLSTTALVAKCSVFRIPPAPVNELTATKQALRSTARRIRNLNNEIAELKTPIAEMITAAAPQLLNQRGVGPITAAQVLIAWSHPGRCRNEAAFARLAGVAPLQASSGQHTRHRLNRRGDRQLNHSYL